MSLSEDLDELRVRLADVEERLSECDDDAAKLRVHLARLELVAHASGVALNAVFDRAAQTIGDERTKVVKATREITNLVRKGLDADMRDVADAYHAVGMQAKVEMTPREPARKPKRKRRRAAPVPEASDAR